MKPIPLFGTGIKSIATSITAQRRLNCFFDLRQDGDKTTLAVIGTFGLLLWTSLPLSPIRGWRVVGNYLYAVAGSSVYQVNSAGNYTVVGTIPYSPSRVALSDNYTQLIIVDGVAGYVLTISTLVFATITDVNFPNGATSVDFIDGWFIVNQAGSRQAFVSASYDGITWTPVSYFTKAADSDLLLAVSVFADLILLMGASSLEFWQDAGASPLPFTRISGATQQYGLAAIYSRAIVNNAFLFLALNPEGTVQIAQLSSGYVPQVVSTPDLESIIKSFTVYADATAFGYVAFGHPMYQITFPNAGRSFLFDLLTGIWYELQTGLGLTGRHQADLGISFGVNSYASDYQNGNIYQFSPTTYTDNGVPIKRQVTSKHIVNSGDTITVSELQLDMQLGVGNENSPGNNPMITVETSKDGGNTFGTPRPTSIGTVGQYRSPRAYWKRFGKSKSFVFRFTMTDPVQFAIAQAYVDVS